MEMRFGSRRQTSTRSPFVHIEGDARRFQRSNVGQPGVTLSDTGLFRAYFPRLTHRWTGS